jgi:polar amino acid transport system substrate-binding protein
MLANGDLIVAVAKNFPPFGYKDENGDDEGFDIDIAREFAYRWLGDKNAVEFNPVEWEQRLPILK